MKYNPSTDRVNRTLDRHRIVDGYKQEMIRSKLYMRNLTPRIIIVTKGVSD